MKLFHKFCQLENTKLHLYAVTEQNYLVPLTLAIKLNDWLSE